MDKSQGSPDRYGHTLTARNGEALLGYRELAEAMPQQVWTAQPDGQLDYVNQRVLDYFERSSADLLGAGWLDVVHPEDQQLAIRRWTAALGSGELYEIEFRLRRTSDALYRWHLGRAVSIRDEHGRIVRWLGTNTDIHDRKIAEEELQKARVLADAANAAKSRFLASMSHELRTPLNAVIGYSEMLEEETSERGLTEFTQDVRKIRRAAGYLLELIDNVLDLSRIEAGKLEIALEDFDICAMVMDVVNTCGPLIRSNGNILNVDCPSGSGLMRSDRTKIRQCLLNLLSNAAKFTRAGRICVQVEGEKDTVRFRISDTGSGMNPQQVARLFEPFTQVHTTGQTGGTGLGLVITRRLCNLLGGEVAVRSDAGEGSEFTIRLPRLAPALDLSAGT